MTGDPTQRLPCDGMVEETDAMIARVDGDTGAVLDMLRRHRAALASCREHCWIRNQPTRGA